MTHSYDVEFGDAVRAAVDGNVESLVAILRSGAPIGRGERELLADYVSGEFNRPRGRPPKAKTEPEQVRRAVVEYLDRTDAGEKSEAVAVEMCERLDIERSNFFSSLNNIRPVIDRLNAMGLDGRAVMSPK